MAFGCDATVLVAGDIVRIESPLSSSGRQTYAHDFIVLFVPDDLKVGDRIRSLVALLNAYDRKGKP